MKLDSYHENCTITRKNESSTIRVVVEELKSRSSLILSLLSLCMPIILGIALGSTLFTNHVVYAAYTKATPSLTGPTVNDPSLKVERVFAGDLQIPTSMAFLAPNDILVLEKNKGLVDRIVNGKLLPQPLLQIPNIANQEVEWGLLGIAIDKAGTDSSGHTYVFLYYTEKGSDGERARNHLYRYELSSDGSRLVNPLLLLNLPATSPDPDQESNHDGGKVMIGPDHNVYTAIGDVGGHRGQAQNDRDGSRLDGTSGILRVTENGKLVSSDPLGKEDPTGVYYAYGIRNSFGFGFDPITSNIWDTENGADDNDEVLI